MYPCILFYFSAISHPANVKVDFASIGSIQGCAKIVPDDGEASKRGQQHGMQEVRRHVEGVGSDNVGTSIHYEGWCIYQNESQRGTG